MARTAVWLVIVVSAALVQTTWPDALKLQEVQPDLVLLIVVYFALIEGEERAMFTALIGGIYQDVAGNNVLGHHVLCLVIVGYAAGRVSTRLVTEHPAVKAGLTLLAALAHGVLYSAVLYVQQPVHGFVYPVVSSVVPGAFYTALITPLAFFLLSWVFHRREAAAGGLA